MVSDILSKWLEYRPCPACKGERSTGCLKCHGAGKLMGPDRSLNTAPDNAGLRADFESVSFRCSCGAPDELVVSLDPSAGQEEVRCEDCGKRWLVYMTPRVDISVHDAAAPSYVQPYAEGTY